MTKPYSVTLLLTEHILEKDIVPCEDEDAIDVTVVHTQHVQEDTLSPVEVLVSEEIHSTRTVQLLSLALATVLEKISAKDLLLAHLLISAVTNHLIARLPGLPGCSCDTVSSLCNTLGCLESTEQLPEVKLTAEQRLQLRCIQGNPVYGQKQ
jgi:hypothetical protein